MCLLTFEGRCGGGEGIEKKVILVREEQHAAKKPSWLVAVQAFHHIICRNEMVNTTHNFLKKIKYVIIEHWSGIIYNG